MQIASDNRFCKLGLMFTHVSELRMIHNPIDKHALAKQKEQGMRRATTGSDGLSAKFRLRLCRHCECKYLTSLSRTPRFCQDEWELC